MKKPLKIRATGERVSIRKAARMAMQSARGRKHVNVGGCIKRFIIATAERHHVICENGCVTPMHAPTMERPRET